MNLFGSYTKLLGHSKSAVVAAIEIYNKPRFEHREEILSMLLANAWELMFLAILSKNKTRIFEDKQRNQPYKTLSFGGAVGAVKGYFPETIDANPVIENIKLIRAYRNAATHYYNETQHKHAIYALAHASIKNYRDLCFEVFKQDIASEVSMVLLPLSFNAPPDFVEYVKGKPESENTPLVRDLLATFQDTEARGMDTSRLIISCKIKFDRTKDSDLADIIAGRGDASNALVVERFVNPNDSHPFRMRDIIGVKGGKPPHPKLEHRMNQNDFQAVVWKHNIQQKPEYCWKPSIGGSPRYSQKMLDFLNGLTQEQIREAKIEYKNRNKNK